MNVPKVTPVPPPPAPSPTMQDEQVLAARQNEARRQKALYGRRSTILSGSTPAPSNLAAPTLLGA